MNTIAIIILIILFIYLFKLNMGHAECCCLLQYTKDILTKHLVLSND